MSPVADRFKNTFNDDVLRNSTRGTRTEGIPAIFIIFELYPEKIKDRN